MIPLYDLAMSTSTLSPCWLDLHPQFHSYHCDRPFAISSVVNSFSGPKDIGNNCSSVMTTHLPSLSYISIGILSCDYRQYEIHDAGEDSSHTSQNSRMNCRHIPQGLAGGLISVATAIARMSPFLAPWYTHQNLCFSIVVGADEPDKPPSRLSRAQHKFPPDRLHSQRWHPVPRRRSAEAMSIRL